MAQGIPWDKKEVTELLKPYLQLGYSVTKACKLIGIPQQTVDTWIQDDEELRLKVTAWQNEISVIARKQWKKNIIEGRPTKFGLDDYTPSKEWLERIEREDFSTRSETDVTSQGQKIEAGIFVTDFKSTEDK